MDACSRKIIGWSMADHLEASLVIDALEMALHRRRPAAGLMVHSDRGVQYACQDYQGVLARNQLVCSDESPRELLRQRDHRIASTER